MILLTPMNQSLEELKAKMTTGATLADVEMLIRYMTDNRDNPLAFNNLSVAYAKDRDGAEYFDVKIRVESVFKRDGVLWVAGGGIALDYDAMLECLEEIKEYLATGQL